MVHTGTCCCIASDEQANTKKQLVHRQVAVQWTTNEEAAGAVVQYGTSAGHYTGSATATFDTYTRKDMCGGEAATTGYLFPGE